MKRNRILLIAVSLLLLASMTLSFVGCGAKKEAEALPETVKKSGETENEKALPPSKVLSESISPNNVDNTELIDEDNVLAADFAVRLFKASEKDGENTLISPLSVLYALAMTQNGAGGATLSQMEEVLGLPKDKLNSYLSSYVKTLPQGESYKMTLANSIWFKDSEDFTVDHDFLQTNADYYSADIFKSAFNEQTLKDVNTWVNESTDGMIPHILDEMSKDSVMYLINALAFDAEWASKYFEFEVREDFFTREDGNRSLVEFMHGSESRYLSDGKATGFMKNYAGGGYAFVAMLPNKGVSISEYIESLDGKKLHDMLSDPQRCEVITKLPKFETEYDVEMSDILKGMGMSNAFDINSADFSGIGTFRDNNICIGKVIHKTFISVGESGTKAGAATIIDMIAGAAADGEDREPPKEVFLDRPFVYMLIDTENNVPFFIGTMMNPGE